jgi:hypothetical protein
MLPEDGDFFLSHLVFYKVAAWVGFVGLETDDVYVPFFS